jgi:hypothetical protein
MTRSCVIVYERKGVWAATLRRRLSAAIGLRETRGLAECADELEAAPGSLLALETTRKNLSGVLDLLADVARRYPGARAVVLAERGLEPYEWLMREAGAAHFTTSPREAEDLARLAERHVGRAGSSQADPAARIWRSLPWSDAATVG